MKTVRDIEIELEYLDSIERPSLLEKNRRAHLNNWRNQLKSTGQTRVPADFEDYIDEELANSYANSYDREPVFVDTDSDEEDSASDV